VSKVFRTALSWLIALIVPVQGMAALAVPLCPAAHGLGVSAGIDHVAYGLGADAQWALAADLAAQAGAPAHHAADSDSHDGALQGKADPCGHGPLDCCSAACAMVAALAPVRFSQVPPRSPVPPHPLAQRYRGLTPDGLDRPPKIVFA
jgi:hypothetical protein